MHYNTHYLQLQGKQAYLYACLLLQLIIDNIHCLYYIYNGITLGKLYYNQRGMRGWPKNYVKCKRNTYSCEEIKYYIGLFTRQSQVQMYIAY